jgi:hypothetical protein
MRTLKTHFFALTTLCLAGVYPSIGAAESVMGQTAAQADFSQSGDATTNQLFNLIASYHAASDLEKPNIARQVARVAREIPTDNGTTIVRVRALLVASQQAASDWRKDAALAKAKEAVSLMAGYQGAEQRELSALSSVALARAQIQQSEHLAAIQTIADARRAYGPMGSDTDKVWDELVMWEAIAKASVPRSLKSEAMTLGLTPEEQFSLTGERGAKCGQASMGVVRLEGVGLNPFAAVLTNMSDGARGGLTQNSMSSIGSNSAFPVLGGRQRTTGGVALRGDVRPDGTVANPDITAFAPSYGMAAAAQLAAPTWQFRVPAGLPEQCRANVLTVLAFSIH